MRDAPDAKPLKLTREVEPPQRTQSGIGVLLVASSAMFFAVAASAFIIRARTHYDQVRLLPVAPAAAIAPAAPVAAPASPCGEPSFVDNGDGTLTVSYDVRNCPTLAQ